jgi:hypothetical protein
VREELEKIRDWANAKIATGQETPWSWYQYMKLRETLDEILGGMMTAASLTQSGSSSGAPLRLVDETYQQEIARHRAPVPPLLLPL